VPPVDASDNVIFVPTQIFPDDGVTGLELGRGLTVTGTDVDAVPQLEEIV
jgi:hypothetical protein